MNAHVPAIVGLALAALGPRAGAATFLVTNVNDSGAGSLRQAIINANAAAGTDTIAFQIPGAGFHTIFVTSPLQTITGTVIIDGATQPGYGGIPLIELAGDLAGVGADGFVISNNASTIRAIIINGFNDNGIYITGTGGATVTGCFIGVGVDGVFDGYPNGGHGVFIDNSPNNIIGGSSASQRNIISNNLGVGVRILGFDSTDNLVQGNSIGLDVSGTLERANGSHGVRVEGASENLIGGANPGAGNLVSGQGTNIHVLSGANNVIQGNVVGLFVSGAAVVPGSSTGMTIQNAPNTIVGGPSIWARNIFAGASLYNLDVVTGSGGTIVENNYFGTDVTGMTALGGGAFAGLNVFNTCNVQILNNVASGNDGTGIQIRGSSSQTCSIPNLVYGNLIGVAADGASPLGNDDEGVGVSLYGNQRIGGPTAGQPNIIAHNGGPGVLVTSAFFNGPPASQVGISANLIYDNGGLGIDLTASSDVADGVTANDPGDTDAGPNLFQNYPVLTFAGAQGTSLTVVGSLNCAASSSYRIELFGNDECDPSGHGEGQYYLGFFDVTTDGSGVASFNRNITANQLVFYYWSLTATARRISTNDTSEFSACIDIVGLACGGASGNCYGEGGNGTPGCATFDCCNSICDFDPYCCDTAWDAICADEAATFCADGGTIESGDCFTANPTPGCYDVDCMQIVCLVDPFCCTNTWDAACAAQAASMCEPQCPGDIPLISPGSVDINDLLFLLASWGESGPPRPRADLAPPPFGDNQVDVTDLLELLANWGPCL